MIIDQFIEENTVDVSVDMFVEQLLKWHDGTACVNENN